MKEDAEKATQQKLEKPEADTKLAVTTEEQTTPVTQVRKNQAKYFDLLSRGLKEAPPTPPTDERFEGDILNVKGREFKMSNATLKIGDVEDHPATRIVFEEPQYIEWLIYYINKEYHNLLRHKDEKLIKKVKSKYPPWEDDNETKRDKEILKAFILNGWKRSDATLVFDVLKAGYFNNVDIKNFLWLPQLQIIQAGGSDEDAPDDEKKKSTKTMLPTASDIIFLIENDVLKNDLDNKLFTVDGLPNIIIPHCEPVLEKDASGISNYVEMDIDDTTNKLYSLKEKSSEPLRAELQRLCMAKHGVPCQKVRINEAILWFQGIANQNQKTGVSRIQLLKGVIFYDLMLKKSNKLVKITKSGCELIDFKDGMMNPEDDNFVFIQYAGQLPQVVPSSTPDIEPMYKYFTLEDDVKTKFLVMDVITMFYPDIEQPIRQHDGLTDGGKTFKSKATISIVDPQKSKLGHGFSRKETPKEMVRKAHAGYLLAYDNVSKISKDQNDTLARITTGVNEDDRALFTDDTSHSYESFTRPVVINGIGTEGTEADVLNRSTLFESNLKNKSDKRKLNKKFEEDKPHLLAAIFGILSKALQYEDEMEKIELPPAVRLREYARFGCAVSKALGNDPEDFLNYYVSTFNKRDMIAVENNPIWEPLITYLQINGKFEGTPQELIDVLEVMFTTMGRNPPFDFPTKAQEIGKEIKKIEKNFGSQGVIFENDMKNNRAYYIFTYKDFVKPSKRNTF